MTQSVSDPPLAGNDEIVASLKLTNGWLANLKVTNEWLKVLDDQIVRANKQLSTIRVVLVFFLVLACLSIAATVIVLIVQGNAAAAARCVPNSYTTCP